MKVFGKLALGSSSARKYLRTCVSCFQKLRVSCKKKAVSVPQPVALVFYSPYCGRAYLEFDVAVVDEDVGGLELRDVAVALKLLPHLGADGGDGHVEGVHGLDLGGLWFAPRVSPAVHISQSTPKSPALFSRPRRFRVFVPHAASPGRT